MAASHSDIDFAALIALVTDSLGPDTPPASSTPPAGFTLHRGQMGQHHVLVKFFSGLPQGCLSHSESKTISKAFVRELGIWKHYLHSGHFVHIIGRSEYIDSIVPCPVYEQTVIAKEYLKERKDVDLLAFILRITEGIEIMHSKNIVHGDIRADNILIGSDGRPRISDYGLTRVVSLLDEYNCRGKTDVTPATRWMPPESMSLDDDVPYNPSKQGDIWSLGMMIYELWSGNIPYTGTSIEKVPSKIRRCLLPEFPGELMPHHEALREKISFLCNLCWQKNPAERKTAAEIACIIRELVEGKSISSTSREFDSRGHRQSPPKSGYTGWHFSTDSSTLSSDSSAISGTESIEVRSIVSPSDSNDSGYETVTSRQQGQSRRTTVKTEDEDENDTASTWSHDAQTQGDAANGSNDFQSAGNIRTSKQRVHPQRPSQKPTFQPFSGFPPPPSPNSPLSSVASWMTALTNYKAKHKEIVLDIERKSVGEDHQPSFTTVCKINGIEYSRASDHRKKAADEKAAQVALTRLYNENPALAAESTPCYLSTFKTYLEEHGLTSRIEMKYDKVGVEHNLTWTCILLRDGKELSRGTAARKQDATEAAARTAALSWSRR